MEEAEWDVVIIGAGLTGINAAYRLQTELPGTRFVILEARDRIGGTWSFWNYPGFRTDSSTGSFAFPWHPWLLEREFATGKEINAYLEDAAKTQGIDARIRLQSKVVGASWSSDEQRWALEVRDGAGTKKKVKAGFVLWCTGYYDYARPLEVDIPGLDNFGGEVVHPQFWSDAVDLAGKRVILIGSGATAVTLLPELVKDAAHVTMLQRSPSYVFSQAGVNGIDNFMRRWLPSRLAANIIWWHHLVVETVFIGFMTKLPTLARKILRATMKSRLPSDVDVDVHFNPSYPPFDQRLCFCPDGDFFKALHRDNCDIVTDVVDTVTKTGIRLRSGKTLDADVIITATGLHLVLLDGLSPVVDGKPVDISKQYVWRGSLLEGVPNSAAILGYTTATWTPGVDVRVRLIIQIMKRMRKLKASSVVAVVENRARLPRLPVLPNSSTYIRTAADRTPVVAGIDPWVNGNDWVSDSLNLWFKGLQNGLKYTIPSSDKKN